MAMAKRCSNQQGARRVFSSRRRAARPGRVQPSRSSQQMDVDELEICATDQQEAREQTAVQRCACAIAPYSHHSPSDRVGL